MHTPDSLSKALASEYVILHRAGSNHATEESVADFIAGVVRAGATPPTDFPKFVYAYYANGGKDLRFTLDKQQAELNADGFKWSNPRVRKVGIIRSL